MSDTRRPEELKAGLRFPLTKEFETPQDRRARYLRLAEAARKSASTSPEGDVRRGYLEIAALWQQWADEIAKGQ